MQDAIEFANYNLRELVVQNPALKGMGTTCVLALVNNGNMYVAHAGDSRLYLLRNGEIKQISKDHSVVQDMIDRGSLTEEEAEKSEKKNQITKALGIFERVNPSVTDKPVHLLRNDKILLCSDGLTGHVSNQSINESILKNDDIQIAALELIEKANAGGGTDNITVQIIQYSGNDVVSPVGQKSKRKYFIITGLLLSLLAVCIFLILGINKKNNPVPAGHIPVKTKAPIINDSLKESEPKIDAAKPHEKSKGKAKAFPNRRIVQLETNPMSMDSFKNAKARNKDKNPTVGNSKGDSTRKNK